MAFIPVIVVVVFVLLFTPSSPKRGRRRKSKGFIGSLMSEKPSGVMCGPGGVGARGGKRKR